MFKKRKKPPPTISQPLNFEHKVNVTEDKGSRHLVGVPSQWTDAMRTNVPSYNDSLNRRQGFADPSKITPCETVQPVKTIVVGKNSTLRKPGFVSIARSNSLRAAIDAHNTKLVQNAEPVILESNLEEKESTSPISHTNKFNVANPSRPQYNNFQVSPNNPQNFTTNHNNYVQSPMYNNSRNQQPFFDPKPSSMKDSTAPQIISRAANGSAAFPFSRKPEVPFSANNSHHPQLLGSNPAGHPSPFSHNFDHGKKMGVNTSNETDSGVYSLNEEMNNLFVQNCSKVRIKISKLKDIIFEGT